MEVRKTLKHYMNGAFVRSESGKTFSLQLKKGVINLSEGTIKDLRNSFGSTIQGANTWSGKSPFNRSQILYRLGEILSSRRTEFIEVLSSLKVKKTKLQWEKDFDQGVDNLVFYAGFCDKFSSLLGTLNPVSGPFHNFTSVEPMGATLYYLKGEVSFSLLLHDLAALLAAGNSSTVIICNELGALGSALAEAMETCDLPAGVLNILTTNQSEALIEGGSKHMEVQAFIGRGLSKREWSEVGINSAENLKRLVNLDEVPQLDLSTIRQLVEFKTLWHPQAL